MGQSPAVTCAARRDSLVMTCNKHKQRRNASADDGGLMTETDAEDKNQDRTRTQSSSSSSCSNSDKDSGGEVSSAS